MKEIIEYSFYVTVGLSVLIFGVRNILGFFCAIILLLVILTVLGFFDEN